MEIEVRKKQKLAVEVPQICHISKSVQSQNEGHRDISVLATLSKVSPQLSDLRVLNKENVFTQAHN